VAVLKVSEVEAKLRELNGNMAAVARHFGVTRAAVWLCVQKHESLKKAQHDCREGMKDNAESSLYRAILNGEAWAVCFFLKTQAKDRGYVERTEHTGPDGRPIQTETGSDDRITTRINRLAAAFEALADCTGPGRAAGNGDGEPVDTGNDQGRLNGQAGPVPGL
jgi:hypothetical protein